jgi:hypothetical protein
MAVIFTFSPEQVTPVTKASVGKWLGPDFSQNLGFLGCNHYYKQATKHGIIQEYNKKLTLLPLWHQFVQAVLLSFEKSTNRDVGQLLRAIVGLCFC